MKAKLIFKLPDDRKSFNAAAKADSMAMVLWEIVYNVRKGIEREYEAMSPEGYDDLGAMDGADLFAERIGDVLAEHGIDIDDLTE